MPTNRRFPLHYITPKNPVWDRVTDFAVLVSEFTCKRVRIADLVGIQAYVTIAGVEEIKATCDRRPPFVVKIAGVYYIRDGHHRVTAAMLAGRKTITAEVRELEETNV